MADDSWFTKLMAELEIELSTSENNARHGLRVFHRDTKGERDMIDESRQLNGTLALAAAHKERMQLAPQPHVDFCCGPERNALVRDDFEERLSSGSGINARFDSSLLQWRGSRS